MTMQSTSAKSGATLQAPIAALRALRDGGSKKLSRSVTVQVGSPNLTFASDDEVDADARRWGDRIEREALSWQIRNRR